MKLVLVFIVTILLSISSIATADTVHYQCRLNGCQIDKTMTNVTYEKKIFLFYYWYRISTKSSNDLGAQCALFAEQQGQKQGTVILTLNEYEIDFLGVVANSAEVKYSRLSSGGLDLRVNWQGFEPA